MCIRDRLTGLLYCSCGSRMYPKLSQRKTPDGKQVYTYVCRMKERSRRTVCSSKNVNGNILDMAVVQELKLLEEDREAFLIQLKKSRKIQTGERTSCREGLTALKKEKKETEKKIEGLADSLAELEESAAREHVVKRMEQLNREWAVSYTHLA